MMTAELSFKDRSALAMAAREQRAEYLRRAWAAEVEQKRQQEAAARAEQEAADRFCDGLDDATLERTRRIVLRRLPALYGSLEVRESRTLRLAIYRLLSAEGEQ